MATPNSDQTHDPAGSLSRRHLWAGWAGLLIFLSFGIILESLHGLKLNSYLDPRNVTRRLMWTLAHAHGTLFSLIQIAFAVSLNSLRAQSPKALKVVSRCLIGSLITMPLGFFLGGLSLYGGDPGVGIILVPVGALMMLTGVGTFLLVFYRDRPLTKEDAESRMSPDAHARQALMPERPTSPSPGEEKSRDKRRK